MLVSRRNLTIVFVGGAILSVALGYFAYKQSRWNPYPYIEIRNVTLNGQAFQKPTGEAVPRAGIDEGDEGLIAFDVYFVKSSNSEEPIYPDENTDITVSITDMDGHRIETSNVGFLSGGITRLKSRFMAPFAEASLMKLKISASKNYVYRSYEGEIGTRPVIDGVEVFKGKGASGESKYFGLDSLGTPPQAGQLITVDLFSVFSGRGVTHPESIKIYPHPSPYLNRVMVTFQNSRTFSEGWNPLSSPSAATNWFMMSDEPIVIDILEATGGARSAYLQVFYTGLLLGEVDLAEQVNLQRAVVEQKIQEVENSFGGLDIDLVSISVLPGWPGTEKFDIVVKLNFDFSGISLGELALIYTVEVQGKDSAVYLSLSSNENMFGQLVGLENAVVEAVSGSESDVEASIDAELAAVPESATVHVVLNHTSASWERGRWVNKVGLIIVGE